MLLPLVIGFYSSTGFSIYFRSPVGEAKLSSLIVKTEEGPFYNLSHFLTEQKHIVLLPTYYSCQSSCPLISEKLSEAIAQSSQHINLQVVLLSFNEHDQLADIKRFRQHHHLPKNWILTIAQSEASARNELNQYGYQFQKIGNEYDHPASSLVFSKNKKNWVGTISGIDIQSKDFDEAVEDANFNDEVGFTHWLFHFFMKPEYYMMMGFFGIFSSLIVIIIVLAKNRLREI